MAEPIGVTSALVALTVFAFQSSKTLVQLIDSFQNHGRNVQSLKDELTTLTAVLGSLQDTVNQNVVDLSSLKLPLLHCGKACEEFAGMISKWTSHTKEPRTSFRDWFKLSYKGKDISSFTSLVASYKSTIAIALGDANLRTSNVTAKLLAEYRLMISSTTYDLEEILHSIDTSMRDPTLEDSADPPQQGETQTSVEEERASIQQCLRICMDVSSHLDQVQAQDFADLPVLSSHGKHGTATDKPGLARLITSETLTDCKRGIGFTAMELQVRLKDANRRLANAQKHQELVGSEGTSQDLENLLDSVKQCLSICENAAQRASEERINVFEDVSMADDGHQLIISTMGDLISARRVTAGARSIQWLGQMSDTSLQQLSKDQACDITERVGPASFERGTHFENRHGTGRKLS